MMKETADEGGEGDGSTNLSGSVLSASGDGNSLTGVKNRLHDTLRFANFQEQRRPLPFQRWLSPLTVFSYFLQLASFALDPSLFFSSDAARSAPFSSAPWFEQVFRVLRYVRQLREYNLGFLVFSLVFSTLFIALLAVELFIVWRSSIGFRRGYPVLKLVDTAFSVLAPLLLSISLLSFSGHGPAAAVGGGYVLAVLLVNTLRNTGFLNDYRPLWSSSAIAHPRIRFIYATSRLALVVLDTYVNNSSMAGASRAAVVGYASCVFVILGFLFVAEVFVQPFFKNILNRGSSATFCSSFCSSVFALAASLSSVSAGPWLLLAAVIALAGGFGGGYISGLLRERLLARKVRLFISGGEGCEARLGVLFPFEIDLAARFVYNTRKGRGPTKAEIDLADAIHRHGIERFPKSPFVRIAYATFLIEIAQDAARMRQQLRAAKALKPPFDLDFIIYCLSASSSSVRGASNEGTEMDLLVARLNHSAAKKAMAEFWTKVSHARQTLDGEQLLSIAGRVEHHEEIANSIFRHLLCARPSCCFSSSLNSS